MRHIGTNIITLQECDSTNNWLKRERGSLPSGTAVSAELQTAGRGRMDRSWESKRGGGLYLSVLLKPGSYENLSFYPLIAALAVCRALGDVYNIEAHIKWPNDVLVNKRKICGILTETVSGDCGPDVIIGIGVNINQESFCGELAAKAVSVRIITGSEQNGLTRFRDALLSWLDSETARLWVGETAAIRRDYIARWMMEGAEVCYMSNGRNERGVVAGLGTSGELVVRTETGSLLPLISGEASVKGIY